MRYIILLLLLASCARAPLKRLEDAMRPLNSTPELIDSLSRESFFTTLEKHIEVMKNSKQITDPMTFGERKITKLKYLTALQGILDHNDENWIDWIKNNFDFYEVYGQQNWGEVMSTGYYAPEVRGSHKKNEEFSQAIYTTPNDMISVNLKYFANKFPKGEHPGILQGRLKNKTLIPYYTRQEIDSEQKLSNLNLELAWLSPIDAFFIQIQGSGTVIFENGEKMQIGYDSQNGHNYAALGKFLHDVIPMKDMSMQKIEAYLKTLNREDQQKVLNKNPSYVFFKKIGSDGLTYAGMEVSSGRTIATDLKFFPKGALAFLDIEEPQFETPTAHEPTSWLRLPRFVLDQDTGGAIKGGGRVDLYFGSGALAAQKAGVMKQKGRLYYLFPKN
jgi:membrane-bound lytic murein transglycosylase A